MGAEGALWKDAEGMLSSGIERRLPSGIEEKSSDCARGDGLLRDVEGGLSIGAEAWGSLVIGGYSDCFCCKPNTTGLMSHVVLMRQTGMVGINSYIPPKWETPQESKRSGSLSNLQPVAMLSAVESAVLREERARSCSISGRVRTD